MVKELVGRYLTQAGAWDRLLRMWGMVHAVIILAYHRVIEKCDRTLDYSQPGMVVTADTFDRQLQFLKKYFDIVPLSFLAHPQSAIRNPKRPLCSITFDDGWRDNYEIAFPILRQHDLPATIFLTTDFIGADRVFWHTELMYRIMHGDASRFRLVQHIVQAYPERVGRQWRRLVRSAGLPTAYDLDPLIEAVKETCSEDEIAYLIRDLRHALATSGSLWSRRRFFLDWDQVCEMAGAGIEIGSHGCSHRILTRLKSEDAKAELVQSKREIERAVGQRIHHFAFPDGAANGGLIVAAKEAGYRTVCLGTVTAELGGGSLTVPRLGMHEGVSAGIDRAFSEGSLVCWLFRALRRRMAWVRL